MTEFYRCIKAYPGVEKDTIVKKISGSLFILGSEFWKEVSTKAIQLKDHVNQEEYWEKLPNYVKLGSGKIVCVLDYSRNLTSSDLYVIFNKERILYKNTNPATKKEYINYCNKILVSQNINWNDFLAYQKANSYLGKMISISLDTCGEALICIRGINTKTQKDFCFYFNFNNLKDYLDNLDQVKYLKFNDNIVEVKSKDHVVIKCGEQKLQTNYKELKEVLEFFTTKPKVPSIGGVKLTHLVDIEHGQAVNYSLHRTYYDTGVIGFDNGMVLPIKELIYIVDYIEKTYGK